MPQLPVGQDLHGQHWMLFTRPITRPVWVYSKYTIPGTIWYDYKPLRLIISSKPSLIRADKRALLVYLTAFPGPNNMMKIKISAVLM